MRLEPVLLWPCLLPHRGGGGLLGASLVVGYHFVKKNKVKIKKKLEIEK
jgi:hypothetical protein